MFYITALYSDQNSVLKALFTHRSQTRQAASLPEIFSYHYTQSRRKHFDGLARQREDFAIHHYIDRRIKLKLDPPNRMVLRQRVACVRAVIQRRQIANQPHSSDRTPPHIFNQSVIGGRVGGDHHCAAGKFAVIETKKQTGTPVELVLFIEAHRKRPPVKPCQAQEN